MKPPHGRYVVPTSTGTSLSAAIHRGAGYMHATAEQVIRDSDRIAGHAVTMPSGEMVELPAEVVVDASGQATFLANRGLTKPQVARRL